MAGGHPYLLPREAAGTGRSQGGPGVWGGSEVDFTAVQPGLSASGEVNSLTYQERGSRPKNQRHRWNSSGGCYLYSQPHFWVLTGRDPISRKRQCPWQVSVGTQVPGTPDLKGPRVPVDPGHCKAMAGADAKSLRDYPRWRVPIVAQRK